MWLYSVREWCSPNQAYFQLCLSAKIDVLGLAHEHRVLELGVVGRRAGDVAVEEDAELHDASVALRVEKIERVLV